MPPPPRTRLTRRALVALIAYGLVLSQRPRPRRAVEAADPPGMSDDDRPRTALAATTGPPRIPSTLRLRLASGSDCSIDMEEYLKGVVPAEMPASWPAEALRAQAVAARTYAASYVATYGYICATSTCQAWDPSRRDPRSDAAVDATRGTLLTYQSEMIWAFYSSTCGGQTATTVDDTKLYCRSIRCWREADGSGSAPLDLSSESAAAAFWAGPTQPKAFCSPSPSFRYAWSLARTDVETFVNRFLPSIATVSPRYTAGALGQLTDYAVIERAISGKATAIRIAGTGGAWTVTGETALRTMLRSSTASPQRSANAVISLDRSGETVTRLNGRGGGYGHGFGLCQYGAKGMADRGYSFQEILQHYYQGVSLVEIGPTGFAMPPRSGQRTFIPYSSRTAWSGCG